MPDEHMTISLKSSKPTLPPRRAPRYRRIYALLFVIFFFAALIGGGYVVYSRFTAPSASTPSVSQVSYKSVTGPDTQNVVDKVGLLMLLPKETPTVAVVSDLSKLHGQLFFANAEQGDIVLMYAHAQKAILYSPTLNKIIEVAPITNDK